MAKKTYKFNVTVRATIEVDAYCDAEAECLAKNFKLSDLTNIHMETNEAAENNQITLDIAAE